jgi:hypothetical protein
VIPFRTDRLGGVEPGEGDGAVGTPIQIFIEGMISSDVLDDVIDQISERVRNNDVGLLASDSFNVTQR